MSNRIFSSSKYDFPQIYLSNSDIDGFKITYFVKSMEAHTNTHCQTKQGSHVKQIN